MPEENSAGPSLNFLQKRFGPSFMAKKRKKDIHLTNPDPTDIDPRILREAEKSNFGKMRLGRSILSNLGKKNGS